ncbi:MAG: hypothetical protein ACXVAW_11465 [Vulcanimicrobiaceae bacterium]
MAGRFIKWHSSVNAADMMLSYGLSMFDVAASLMNALAAARSRLGDAASTAARSQTTLGDAMSDGAMAQVAESAIFREALLAAVHARLEEVKSVTRT